jgi:hypothetical protein
MECMYVHSVATVNGGSKELLRINIVTQFNRQQGINR